MIVQIYEIQTPAEARAMIRLGVDHIGTVILSTDECQNPLLKETVETVQTAGRISSLIPLFDDIDAVIEMVEFYRPDIVHLCEFLPPPGGRLFQMVIERQRTLRRRFPEITVIRSIPIGLAGTGRLIPSLEWAVAFESESDWFLTDTLLADRDPDIESNDDNHQPVPGYVGITGQVCDWQVARALVRTSRIPVILAGGIGPGNVVQGIQYVQPAGVDSCTLTNATDERGCTIRFTKDPGKVGDLVRAARSTNTDIESSAAQ